MTNPTVLPPDESSSSLNAEPDTRTSDSSSASSGSGDVPVPETNTEQSSNTDSGSFGAGTWYQDKRVAGLFSSQNARNSWANITGLGWKRLATGSNSACESMTMLASHCREKACRIDFREDGGIVQEIYVW